ncbi:hypothetical protein FRC07_003665 [Ceratobasidium sp. 392]|nr:hypothetical protein FRC07_003665 [Ceratobasidium sp. 392]
MVSYLIRHGKHARAPAAQAASPVVTEHHQAAHRRDRYDDGSATSRTSRDRDRERERAERLERERQSAQEKAQIQMPSTHGSMPAPETKSYAREAEMIVAEEREAASKMPQFPALERYRMIEKMGDGAFSNVYKAVDLQTGKKVAVKVVRKYEMSSSQDGHKHLNEKFKKKGQRVTERANILKEVSIMRGLNHQSIIKLISFAESDEHYFLVLELMGGGELFHQMRGGAANGFLQNLNEEDEDEDEDTEVITRKYGAEVARAVDERRNQAAPPAQQQPQQQQQQQQQYSGAGGADRRMAESQLYQGGRAGPRDQGTAKRRGGGGFDLDMNNATLLGRRHKRQVEPSPLGRFVPQQNADILDVPGSPMRID